MDLAFFYSSVPSCDSCLAQKVLGYACWSFEDFYPTTLPCFTLFFQHVLLCSGPLSRFTFVYRAASEATADATCPPQKKSTLACHPRLPWPEQCQCDPLISLPAVVVCLTHNQRESNEFCTTNHQVLIENKSKFVLVHASSGHKHAVEEILSQPSVQTRLADTKASEEIRALATFFDMLKKDPDRAYYGYNVRWGGPGYAQHATKTTVVRSFTPTVLLKFRAGGSSSS